MTARELQVVRMLQPKCHMPKPLVSHLCPVSRVSPITVFTEDLGWLKHRALWRMGVVMVGTILRAWRKRATAPTQMHGFTDSAETAVG